MSRIQQTVVLDLGASNILISVLPTIDQLILKRIQRYTQVHREYPSSGEKSRWVNARLRLPQFARPAHPNGSFGLSYLLLQLLWAKREKYDRQRRKIQEAEKQAKRYGMRLCKRWRRPISKRFIKPPYSISRATSIDSDCCRLPTTSVLSKKGQFHPLPSFTRNTSLQRFPLVDVVPSWRLPYLVLTILLCLYRTNPHSSEISDFIYFSAKPMTTLLVTNSQVFGVRLEYLDWSKSEGSSGSLRS